MKKQIESFVVPALTLFLLAFIPEYRFTWWFCTFYSALIGIGSLFLVAALIFSTSRSGKPFPMPVVATLVTLHCGVATLMWRYGLVWQACAVVAFTIVNCVVVLEAKLRK
jgi:hypothetical protein